MSLVRCFFPLILLAATLSCHSLSIPKRINVAFGIDIRDIEYSIIEEDEYWIPFNGNGHWYICLSLNSLSFSDEELIQKQMIGKGGIPLPSNETYTVLPDQNLKPYFKPYSDTYKYRGMYILNHTSSDPHDFELFIFDVTNKRIIVFLSNM